MPWSAGTKSDPSYDVSAGSAYTTTQALPLALPFALALALALALA